MELGRTDAPATGEYATVYVAFELSKAKWKLGIVLPGSDKMSRYTINGGDVVALSKLFENVRARAARQGKPVDFSSTEFELLKHFLCHPGETLSRDRLLDEVWGYDHYPTTRTVDAHIVRLRQKLEPVPEEPRFFLTVHGVGYKFVG